MKLNSLTIPLILIAGLLLLPGCTVGPDYVRPDAVEIMPVSFKEGDGWKLAQPEDVSPDLRWWEIYQDPVLSDLIAQVKISNLNVAVAEAQYRQAQALVQSAQSGNFPLLSAGAMATRARSSENLGTGQTISTFELPLALSWEPDLWGRVRRGVEASQANAQASAAELAAITLSAQTELAGAYFQLRVLDAQKQLLDETISNYRRSLDIANDRYAAGVTTEVDALQAKTLLDNTLAQTLDLGVQRAQLEHAIALLIGKPPATVSLSAESLSTRIPEVPAGVPSELLERRPDIAAAERKMAAANARIGFTQAAFYPNIQISATGGFSSSDFTNWLAWPSHFWSVGPNASVDLFDGGLRQAQNNQVLAIYDSVVASYRKTVLTAFKEVEDNLAALRILEGEAEVQDRAVAGAQQVVAITTFQYEAGTLPYLNVLAAQITALNTERTALAILGRRLSASILLVKALGGDWHSELLSGTDKP